MKKLLVLLAILAVFQVAALADPATLELTDIATFAQIGYTGPVEPMTTQGVTSPAVGYTTTWGNTASGYQSANIGTNALNLDLTGINSFQLSVLNDNDSTWDFELFVGGIGSGVVAVPIDTSALLTVDVSSLGAGVSSVYLQVSGDLPINGDDFTAEYKISPVPEPASMLLLGTGLLGLGVMTRKWRS